MTERTANQIARMKEQTIGCEIEMNSITREKAAKIAAEFFGTGRFQNTAARNGYYTWMHRAESGSSRGTFPSQDPTAKSASLFPRF